MSSGLPANLSQNLPNLLELNLCSNQLDSLPAEFTNSLANLQVLRLCDNQLSSINLSSNMINIVNIDLSRNLIRTLQEFDLSGHDSLTHLSLAGNVIAEIDSQAFRNLSSLLVLDISDNKLFSLPEGVGFLTNLIFDSSSL